MVKSKEDTVKEFNEQVNMTAEEIEVWLEDPMSRKAGTGVGLDSARKIIEILKKNPKKNPNQYDDEDIEHMRKVVGYNKRHLAQEEYLKDTKSKEELEKSKSTISLKNWGHDPMKALQTDVSSAPRESSATAAGSGKTDKAGESEDEPSVDKGSKRKHDKVAGTESQAVKDGELVEGGQNEVQDEEQTEERARKKSKTDGIAED